MLRGQAKCTLADRGIILPYKTFRNIIAKPIVAISSEASTFRREISDMKLRDSERQQSEAQGSQPNPIFSRKQNDAQGTKPSQGSYWYKINRLAWNRFMLSVDFSPYCIGKKHD